jgi:hypothetical protein
MALIGGVIRNNSHVALAFANACITGTLNCASTDGYGIWNATWGYEGINVTASAGGFYPTSVNFTSADVAYFSDYGQNGYWKIIELTPQPAPPCCFAGHTLIHMADGSLKLIADVAVGEYVIGRDGEINRVIGVEEPFLGARQLYSINRGEPFVTCEHPFLSETGWSSIDPAALKAEGGDLPVHKLVVGEVLLAAATVRIPALIASTLTKAEIRIENRRVVSLDGHDADAGNTVYNLRLDGNHTYIANGFIVHNKPSSH